MTNGRNKFQQIVKSLPDALQLGYSAYLFEFGADQLPVFVFMRLCKLTDAKAAPGGVSTVRHILEAFTVAKAEAALAAGMFHRGEYTVGQAKDYLGTKGVKVRR